jgi:hypothetical protein
LLQTLSWSHFVELLPIKDVNTLHHAPGEKAAQLARLAPVEMFSAEPVPA